MDLSDKTVVITGASRGLGREVALCVAKKKAHTVLVARTGSELDRVRMEIEDLKGGVSLVVPCDVSKEDDVDRMARFIGDNVAQVDVLVNNAGIGIVRPWGAMTTEEVDRQFAVNVFGPMNCIRALLPLIRRCDSGYILNVASLLARVSFSPTSVYGATKSALSAFSRGLHEELGKDGIGVGLFLPGPMDTSFLEGREGGPMTAPGIMKADVTKAAHRMVRMIEKRETEVLMYRWVLLAMKMKRWAVSRGTGTRRQPAKDGSCVIS